MIVEALGAVAGLSTSLFSFAGSAAFRLVFGEVMAYMNKRIDQAHELLMIDRQVEAEAARAATQRAGLELQAKLQVQVIEAKAEARAEELDGEAFLWGVKATTIKSGIKWIDGWNAAIRPWVATWAICMLTIEAFKWFGVTKLPAGTSEVISAALGLFLSSRDLHRRGK